MNPEEYRKVQDLFLAASEFEGEVRNAYLEKACAGDSSLRTYLEELLAQNDAAAGFLEQADLPADRLSTFDPLNEGEHVGPYRICRKIGEGGFGVVYEAEQRQPVQRRVAMKILKLGMDTRQVLLRFEAERQVLAMLDHQYVAKVLDAGRTDGGRPYFVMEYVSGVSIIDYCNSRTLDIRQRLELFRQVCDAQGIYHMASNPVTLWLH